DVWCYPIAIKLRRANTPKKEKFSRTLINNCEKVKFLLWEVSQNSSLMGMWRHLFKGKYG
ncbi:hypothetical protein, partial [Bacillus sp. H1a]|uniref:hypothetical protein n=1 Tax=Bacillus sp. H1a TaxID=1397276 RepID=UPI0005349D0E